LKWKCLLDAAIEIWRKENPKDHRNDQILQKYMLEAFVNLGIVKKAKGIYLLPDIDLENFPIQILHGHLN
jgi:Tfp pilus assembly protein PilP